MQTITTLFDHLYWANEKLLQSLKEQQLSNKEAAALRIFSHVLHAERVWYTRLNNHNSNALPLWTELDFTALTPLLQENERHFRQYLSLLKPEELDTLVSYTNQHGKYYQTAIRDILTHVAIHGHYHRGQVNLLLRQNGKEPENIDYITYVREH